MLLEITESTHTLRQIQAVLCQCHVQRVLHNGEVMLE